MLYYFVGPFRPLISLAGGLFYSVGAYARRSIDTPQPLSVGVSKEGCRVSCNAFPSEKVVNANNNIYTEQTMKMKRMWGLLLVAVALVMGGCTKENDEPAPAPTFEWATGITADAPVFVVPDASSYSD